MSKYQTLIRILDQIRNEAPESLKKYNPPNNNLEQINQARAKAYIHLYLKVKFGIYEFLERESLITDEGEDGGIDAYRIDKENKIVHIIQSKFRTTEKNYEIKEISEDELVKIEIDRIVKGLEKSEAGIAYNGKIRKFQQNLNTTEHLGQYKFRVVILANYKKIQLLEKLYKDYQVSVFDYERSYQELVFPIVSGTFFKADDLHIKIDLGSISSGQSRVSYQTKIDGIDVDVAILFAPTLEIGRIVSKYRNSLLEYNPRSFLGLSTNPVNSEIEAAITKSCDNRFALFNNGITIVADEAGYSDKTGKRNIAHLDIKNPQIINGGQTAYTLCHIYDTHIKTPQTPNKNTDTSVFFNKEVLLKIITIDPTSTTQEKIKSVIEQISRSTNLQTKIEEADRRSNEKIQIRLQKLFFDKFGFFYERKAGEFHDGINAGYVERENIVDRTNLIRVALAVDFKLSATKTSISTHFLSEHFSNGLLSEDSINKYAAGYVYLKDLESYISELRKETPSDKYKTEQYGNAIRYGRFAVICVATNLNLPSTNTRENILHVLNQWSDFEKWLKKTKNKYLTKERNDYVGYYKGETIDDDVKSFFFKDTPITADSKQIMPIQHETASNLQKQIGFDF